MPNFHSCLSLYFLSSTHAETTQGYIFIHMAVIIRTVISDLVRGSVTRAQWGPHTDLPLGISEATEVEQRDLLILVPCNREAFSSLPLYHHPFKEYKARPYMQRVSMPLAIQDIAEGAGCPVLFGTDLIPSPWCKHEKFNSGDLAG